MQKDRPAQLLPFKARRLAAGLFFVLAAVMVVRAATLATPQAGPNFVVNTLADTDDGSCDVLGQGAGNHDCTLREALNAVSAYGDGAIVTFSVSGTISLGSTLPEVNRRITIDGSGQAVVLNGNNSVLIMQLYSRFFDGDYITVNFNALTFAHGTTGINASFANLNVSNCTFDSNNAGVSAYGGGIYVSNQSAPANISNSTFYNNSSAGGSGVLANSLVVTNCTFYGNNATFNGNPGAIYALGSATIRNCIFAHSPNGKNCSGGNIDAQNLSDDTSCGGATQATLGQINLDTLKDNGGPSMTMALLAGSVAINAGNSAVASAAPVNNVDQRGYGRFSATDSSSDVGAYEFNSPGLLTPLAYWRRLQGLAADGSQDLANPSGDGISNLLKYAFNLAPNAGDLARHNNALLSPSGVLGLPLITRDGQGRLVIEFVRRKSSTGPGIAYAVETGTDLAGLNALDLTGASITSIDATFERVTVVDPTATAQRFGRVRVRALPVYFNDFNAALGSATLYGSALWINQAVQLTDAADSTAGSVILNGITLGSYNSGFRTKFNLQLGPTTTGIPADGVSFAVGTLPAATWGEPGPGGSHEIVVGFDTYDNGGDGAIGIHLWVNGVHIASNPINPYTNGALVPVEITYTAGIGLTVKFNGTVVFNNVPISGFSFLPTDQFGFGGRTGGANERTIIDDVEIAPR